MAEEEILNFAVPDEDEDVIDENVSTEISSKQYIAFKASVDLDKIRRRSEQIGLSRLFVKYSENGNHTWLNPAPDIKSLADIIYKYRGEQSHLVPLIDLLCDLADSGISPAAFLKYVVMPRMESDYNWRNWPVVHYPALQIIGSLLVSMRKIPPFDKPNLGTLIIRLARDVVLVKYIARPLAQIKLSELTNEEYIKSYQEAWKKLILNNSLHLYFMKRNVLPMLYRLSGKIELAQVIQLIEHLPMIESSFNRYYPEGTIIEQYEVDMHLYHRDFHSSVLDRHNKGFRDAHYSRELKSYLRIVAALLHTRAGVYQCSFFAKLLSTYKDPVIAENLESLLGVITDDGGMFVYRWHAENLVGSKKTQMGDFIEIVRLNGGLHPDYVRQFVRGGFSVRVDDSQDKIKEFAKRLKILKPLLEAAQNNKVTFQLLYETWVKNRKGVKGVLANLEEHVKDPRISIDYAKMDEALPDVAEQSAALRKVIPGFTSYFSSGVRTKNFATLQFLCRSMKPSPGKGVSHEFTLTHSKAVLAERDLEDAIRAQINLSAIKSIFNPMVGPSAAGHEAAVPVLANMLTGAEKAAEKNSNEKIKEKIKILKTVIRALQMAPPGLKTLLTMCVAAYFKKAKELRDIAISLLLQRYIESEEVLHELAFLKEDIAIEALNQMQLTRLVAFIENLQNHLLEDNYYRRFLESGLTGHINLRKLCLWLVPLKTKTLETDSLDSAFQAVFLLGVLQKEQSNWLTLLKKSKKTKEKEVKYRMYTSREVLDYYYGDMGGICLTAHSQHIASNTLTVIRLVDIEKAQITGIGLMGLCYEKDKLISIVAFGINPLNSLLSSLDGSRKLQLYMQFRHVYEKVSLELGVPVDIVYTDGYLSNRSEITQLIKKFEQARKPVSIQVNYSIGNYDFRKSLSARIIDPAIKETFTQKNV